MENVHWSSSCILNLQTPPLWVQFVLCRPCVKTRNKNTMFWRTGTSQEMRPSNLKLRHDKESVGNVTWSPYWILNVQTPPSASHPYLQIGIKTVTYEDPNLNPVMWPHKRASFPRHGCKPPPRKCFTKALAMSHKDVNTCNIDLRHVTYN